MSSTESPSRSGRIEITPSPQRSQIPPAIQNSDRAKSPFRVAPTPNLRCRRRSPQGALIAGNRVEGDGLLVNQGLEIGQFAPQLRDLVMIGRAAIQYLRHLLLMPGEHRDDGDHQRA